MIDFSGKGQTLLSALWKNTEATLRQTLIKNPDDLNTLETLGQICRQQGDLESAAEAYRRLLSLYPTHQIARYLHAVFTGTALPVNSPIVLPWPAPFVRIQNFLPQCQRNRLFSLAVENQNEFKPLKVYIPMEEGPVVGKYDSKFRHQVGLERSAEVEDIIKPRILEILPVILPRLQVKPFPIGDIVTQLSLCHNGHFGQVHRDDMDGRTKVSLAYYFHKQPKAFSGGDLLLYDTDLERRSFNRGKFTQIKPDDNTLTLYPSGYYHQITRVNCPTDAFDEGRFAIAGHIETTDECK